MIKLTKTPIDALTGEFKQKHLMGPVVWEQTRKEPDAYYCENNLISTNIKDHATNSSPMTNETSGEAAESDTITVGELSIGSKLHIFARLFHAIRPYALSGLRRLSLLSCTSS